MSETDRDEAFRAWVISTGGDVELAFRAGWDAHSRATKRRDAVIQALSGIAHGLKQGEDMGTATEYMESRDWDALAAALLALDAAEPPTQ